MHTNMMPPQSPQNATRQPEFSLEETREVVCSKCQGNIFKDALFLRTVSKILTGRDKDSLVTIPIVVCYNCNTPYEEMLPPALKSKKLV